MCKRLCVAALVTLALVVVLFGAATPCYWPASAPDVAPPIAAWVDW